MSATRFICPRCRCVYESDQQNCTADALPLLPLEEGADQRVGEDLDDRYTVLGLLGRGGMGAVYRCLQHSMEREVAVKLLRADCALDPVVSDRFIAEARGASRLSHSHIVSLFDFGKTSSGELYLVMERLRGYSLRQLLQRQGSLVPWRAARLASQICSALHHAHSHGIVHRDLKPENVVVVDSMDPRSESAKIIDFGIAHMKHWRPAEPLTRGGDICGTPTYMCPEQASAEGAVDHRCDLYSLGLLLYEMIVGEPTFTHTGIGALLLAHVQEPPVPISQRRPEVQVPPALDALILRLLSKNPAHRPSSALAVKHSLDTTLESAIRIEATLPAGAYQAVKENADGMAVSSEYSDVGTGAADVSRDGRDTVQDAVPLFSLPHVEHRSLTNIGPQPPIIGRKDDLAAIDRLLKTGHRLVTIHGPPGIGKTHLVLSAGTEWSANRSPSGGVWFCDLTEAETVQGVCHAVGETLDVPLIVGKQIRDTIVQLPVGANAQRSLRSRDHGWRSRCPAPVQRASLQLGAGAPA
ncbi:protein kinase [Myxococcota bacterium]